MGNIENNKKIYEHAFALYGDDPRSCLWDTKMAFRYEELMNVGNLNGASILDIGCGIGGFYDFCINDKHICNMSYKGIDVVEGMIELAKTKYPLADFEVHNILETRLNETYDYVILCGIFNVAADMQYMNKILLEAFEYCKKGLAFNFISSYVNFREEEISYHNPQDVFSFCVENLSRKIKMNHHYEKCDVSVFVYR